VHEVTPEMFAMLEAIYEPPAPAELKGAVLSVSDDGMGRNRARPKRGARPFDRAPAMSRPNSRGLVRS
jgi:hypothetical protein